MTKLAETAPPNPPRRTTQALIVAILAAVALTALDIGTKTWAEEALSRARSGEAPPVCEEEDGYIAYQRLRGEPHVLVENVLEFEYAENCGAAFGLMRNAPAIARKVVFGIAATSAVLALFFLFATGRGGPLFAWSVPFVASGALGNLIDRVRYGYVVDFIHVHYEPWDFDYPTFNVADITITVGVILLILDSFRAEPAPAGAADPAAAPAEAPREGATAEEPAEAPATSPAEASTSGSDKRPGADAEPA
jgi:signal peptidase II